MRERGGPVGNVLRLAAVWVAAAVLSLALSCLGVPAAALLAGIAVFCLAGQSTLDTSPVSRVAVPARSLIGAAAGSLVTVAALRSRGPVLLWASLVAVAAMLAGAGIDLAVAKTSGLPRLAAVVALMPGGWARWCRWRRRLTLPSRLWLPPILLGGSR